MDNKKVKERKKLIFPGLRREPIMFLRSRELAGGREGEREKKTRGPKL